MRSLALEKADRKPQFAGKIRQSETFKSNVCGLLRRLSLRLSHLPFGLLGLVTLLSLSTQAKEKIKLMYLESEHETRAAVLLGRLELPLEVYRVGIFRVGKNLYGVIRFANIDKEGALADRHRVGTTVATVCDRIFGELPELVRIDFEGVSKRETKTEKPEVLFSASVDRNSWKTVPKNLLGLARVEQSGTLFFDPRLELGEPPKPKPTSPKKAKAGKVQTKAKPGGKPSKKGPTRDQRPNGELK